MRSMAGRGRGWGADLSDGGSDGFHHPLDITQHIIVPETQHAIAARVEIIGTSRIGSDAMRLVVLSTIELNHEARTVTREVREVRSDRRLAPKMGIIHRQMTEVLPQHALGVGWLVAHRAGTRHPS